MKRSHDIFFSNPVYHQHFHVVLHSFIFSRKVFLLKSVVILAYQYLESLDPCYSSTAPVAMFFKVFLNYLRNQHLEKNSFYHPQAGGMTNKKEGYKMSWEHFGSLWISLAPFFPSTFSKLHSVQNVYYENNEYDK